MNFHQEQFNLRLLWWLWFFPPSSFDMIEMLKEVVEQFRRHNCISCIVVISSSTPFGFMPRLPLMSSQASLALIDPLVRVCGIRMRCAGKCSLQWEGVQEDRNSKRITTRAKQRVCCLSRKTWMSRDKCTHMQCRHPMNNIQYTPLQFHWFTQYYSKIRKESGNDKLRIMLAAA